MRRRSAAAVPRDQALARVVAALRARYGPRIIRSGREVGTVVALGLPLLSTGSFGLDLLTGGLPRGTLSEYAGLAGAGTGTLALAALAACQRAGGLALLVDADGQVDPQALAEAGVDLERLLLACPITATEAWAVLLALGRSGALHLLLLTSFPGLLALPDPHHRWGSPTRGLRQLVTALRGRDTALLLTNRPLEPDPLLAWQVTGTREPAIAALSSGVTLGGAALAQATALRIALERGGPRYGPSGAVVALQTRAQIVKHHGLPHAPVIPLELWPAGPRRSAEVVTLALMTGCVHATPLGLITAEGALLGRSAVQAARALDTDAALRATLEEGVRAAAVGLTGGRRASAVGSAR